MKQISFNLTAERPQEELQVRNSREQLIADIVNATSEKDKKKLARRLSMAANTMHWSDMDLHALLSKKRDPSIRNYTAFIWWSIKISTSHN